MGTTSQLLSTVRMMPTTNEIRKVPNIDLQLGTNEQQAVRQDERLSKISIQSAVDFVLYDNEYGLHPAYARILLSEVGIRYTKVDVLPPFGTIVPSYAAINRAMTIPAMTITEKQSQRSTTLIDSRDIVMYCEKLPGGDKLFPKSQKKAIIDVLDQIYGANACQFCIQRQRQQNALFYLAYDYLRSTQRRRLVRYRDDPVNTSLARVYDGAIVQSIKSYPPLEVLTVRVNKVMIFLDQRLEESNGPWIFGKEFTAADAVTAVWVQWIVWADHTSKVILPPRVVELLEHAKKRPSWKAANPRRLIEHATILLYIATGLLMISCLVAGFLVAGVWSYLTLN